MCGLMQSRECEEHNFRGKKIKGKGMSEGGDRCMKGKEKKKETRVHLLLQSEYHIVPNSDASSHELQPPDQRVISTHGIQPRT